MAVWRYYNVCCCISVIPMAYRVVNCASRARGWHMCASPYGTVPSRYRETIRQVCRVCNLIQPIFVIVKPHSCFYWVYHFAIFSLYLIAKHVCTTLYTLLSIPQFLNESIAMRVREETMRKLSALPNYMGIIITAIAGHDLALPHLKCTALSPLPLKSLFFLDLKETHPFMCLLNKTWKAGA